MDLSGGWMNNESEDNKSKTSCQEYWDVVNLQALLDGIWLRDLTDRNWTWLLFGDEREETEAVFDDCIDLNLVCEWVGEDGLEETPNCSILKFSLTSSCCLLSPIDNVFVFPDLSLPLIRIEVNFGTAAASTSLCSGRIQRRLWRHEMKYTLSSWRGCHQTHWSLVSDTWIRSDQRPTMDEFRFTWWSCRCFLFRCVCCHRTWSNIITARIVFINV